MSASSALAPILGHLRAEPSRTWSLVVTIYGDAVVPRGGSLWLGSLLEIFASLEIGGNVVRTAMSRLAADGWLERTRVGRNSFYRLGAEGGATFAAAAARIYGPNDAAWDGRFRLVLPWAGGGPANGTAPGAGAAERDAVRGALDAAGYAPLAPGVFIAAVPGPEPGLPGATIRLLAAADGEDARRLVRLAWPLERTALGYRRFLDAFGPLRDAVAGDGGLGDLDALVARILLIHEYRRVVLRDPMLPDALLPPDWPGRDARALCAGLYRALVGGSERWLDANGLCESGPLPPPGPDFLTRFAR